MLQMGLKLLSGQDAASICRGAEMLAQTEQSEAIEALLPMLLARSEAVQDCARHALNRMDVIPVLLSWWRGADAEKRAQAARYAVYLSHPGLMDLYQEATSDGTPEQREKAAIGLKHQKPTSEVFHLLALLAADPDKDVRWWAIDSLGILGKCQALSILEERRAKEVDTSLKPFIEKAIQIVSGSTPS